MRGLETGRMESISGQPQRTLSDPADRAAFDSDAATSVSSPQRRIAVSGTDADAMAGPSRRPYTSGSDHDEWMAEFARLSRFPPSALPTTCLRGTALLLQDVFPPSTLAEVDDEALLRSLPFLGPPAPPSGTEPYWGISAQRFELLPSSPTSVRIPVDPAVQSNLARFHELKQRGVHFNENLLSNRAFKNPHVYAQLVDLLDLDESRSNLPALDTHAVGWRAKLPLSHQQLVEGDPIAALTLQQRQHEQRQQQNRTTAGANRTIAFSSATHTDTQEQQDSPAWDKPATSTTTPSDREDWKRSRSSKADVQSKRTSHSDGHHRSRRSGHASSSSRDRPRHH